jgi:Ribbon-helix-helix protein, copG family
LTELPQKKIPARRKANHPVQGVRLHLHVEPYMVEWIDAQAEERGLSRSLFVRELLDELIRQNPRRRT